MSSARIPDHDAPAAASGATTTAGRVLSIGAVVIVVLMLVMLGLGIAIATGTHSLRQVHEIAGYTTLLVAVVVAVAAFVAARAAGRLGVFFHALSLPVLMVVQIGLAEMDLKWVHMVLGVLILVAAIGLVPMSSRLTAPVRTTPAR